jgi:phospholipase/carboxylesterase
MLMSMNVTSSGKACRLDARPARGVRSPTWTGERALGIGRRRDGILYIPSTYDPGRPAPVVLCLHGAGGHARDRVNALRADAERIGAVLVAPDSVGPTWDFLMGGCGADLERIDRALEATFALVAVDPARVAVEGFSDGASYALSLGIDNGDLFRVVLAFSPGFMAPRAPVGSPRIFVAHGTCDRVLSVTCSRRIAPRLTRAGYATLYREFEGGHVAPPEMIREAMDMLRA